MVLTENLINAHVMRMLARAAVQVPYDIWLRSSRNRCSTTPMKLTISFCARHKDHAMRKFERIYGMDERARHLIMNKIPANIFSMYCDFCREEPVKYKKPAKKKPKARPLLHCFTHLRQAMALKNVRLVRVGNKKSTRCEFCNACIS